MKAILPTALAAAFLLAACTAPRQIPSRLTKDEEILVRFSEGGGPFYASDGYSNGGVFGCVWEGGNASFSDVLTLSLTEKDGRIAGAEYRAREHTSYGFYSVSMKGAKGAGVISSFFTYTNRPKWDEIDIEFLGKDTTHIQFNYYSEGRGGHEVWYDLGFDGAEDFHEYAFEWLPESITFYVDGKPVHRAEEDIPTSPTQIMMNIWNCVGAEEWSGVFERSGLPVSAQYEWIGYSAAY